MSNADMALLLLLTPFAILGVLLFILSIIDTIRSRKLGCCPHGYDDWDECPDCRH